MVTEAGSPVLALLQLLRIALLVITRSAEGGVLVAGSIVLLPLLQVLTNVPLVAILLLVQQALEVLKVAEFTVMLRPLQRLRIALLAVMLLLVVEVMVAEFPVLLPHLRLL